MKKCMCEWGSYRDSEWPAAALTKFTFQYFFVLVARCGTGFASILFCSLYRLQSSACLNFTTVQWKAVNYREFWYNQKRTTKLHKCLGSQFPLTEFFLFNHQYFVPGGFIHCMTGKYVLRSVQLCPVLDSNCTKPLFPHL